jgi:hypothetical protein
VCPISGACGAEFDALLRCYLKLLPLLHQASCCHLALAFLASSTGAKAPSLLLSADRCLNDRSAACRWIAATAECRRR